MIRKLIIFSGIIFFPIIASGQEYTSWRLASDGGNWQVLISPQSDIIVRSIPSDATLYLYTDGLNFRIGVNLSLPISSNEIDVDFKDLGTIKFSADTGASLKGANFSNNIPEDKISDVIHLITAAKSAEISVDKRQYEISMNGSTTAIECLSFYAKEHNWTLGSPFTPATPVSVDSLLASPPPNFHHDQLSSLPEDLDAHKDVLQNPQSLKQEIFDSFEYMRSNHMSVFMNLVRCGRENAIKYNLLGNIAGIGQINIACKDDREDYKKICLDGGSPQGCDGAGGLALAAGLMPDDGND